MVSQSRACSFINPLRSPFAGLSLSRSKQHRQRLTAKGACPPPAHPPALRPVTATSGHTTPAARVVGRDGFDLPKAPWVSLANSERLGSRSDSLHTEIRHRDTTCG